MSRTDEYQIQITRKRDNKDFGGWQTMSGAGIDSNEVTTRDGYGLPLRQLGAPTKHEPVTCSRVFYPETDGGQKAELEEGVGSDYFIVNKQKLDPEGNAVGKPDVYTARLKSFKPAEVDVANESPTADTYTIELSVEG